MRRILILIILTLFSIVIYSQKVKQKTYHALINSVYKKDIPLIFADTLSNNLSDFTLLDTRSKTEFDISHIANAKYIGYEDFDMKSMDEVEKDKNIVVYCSVGFRSQDIAQKLQEKGFTNVHNLYGGIFEWKNLNYSIVDGQNNVTDSVHTYNKIWAYWLRNGIKVN